MPHPHHTHLQHAHATPNERRRATAGVPLAVWPAHPDGTHEGAVAHQEHPQPDTVGWLLRLLDECTPDGSAAHVHTCDDPTADPDLATSGGDAHVNSGLADGRLLGLLVLRMEKQHYSAALSTRLLAQARSLLHPGGRLAVVTHPAAAPGSQGTDPVSATVQTAAAAGFGYLQHIVVADLGVDPPDGPPAPPTGNHRQPRGHPVRHLDITLFRRMSPTAVLPSGPGKAGR